MSKTKRTRAQKRATKEAFNKFLSILLTFAMVLQTSPVAYARMDEGGVDDYVESVDVAEETVPEEDVTQEEEYVEQTVPEEEPVAHDDELGQVADEQPDEVETSIYVSSLNATVSIGEDTIADTSSNVTLTEGEDVEFYVTPNADYELVDESVKVVVDGVESVLSGDGTYVLPGSMVMAGTEISVEAFTRTYIYDDDTMRVTVALDEADAIPNNTVLQVVQVHEESYKDDVYTYNYDAYMDALNKSVGAAADKPEYTKDNTLLYDVAFLTVDQETGETIEVEPTKGDALVTFEFKEQQIDGYLRAEQAADVTVAHMPVVDAAKAATTYATTNITADDVVVQYVADEDFGASGTDTIEVKTQSFTVFALANVKKAEEAEETKDKETKPEEKKDEEAKPEEAKEAPKVTTYEGANQDVHVVATVSDPAAIPDEAQLVVRTVRPESSNYDYDAYMQALNDGSDNSVEYKPTNTLLFDVAFIMTDKDGNEYEVQPAEGATVNVDFQLLNDQITKDLDAPSASDVEVTHLPIADEAKGATTNQSGELDPSSIMVEKVDSTATGDESIAITATSFSVYALSYTVDFTLDGLTYSIAGESDVLLSTIFEKLGIEDNVAKVESVVFTNGDLIGVAQLEDGSDWKLTSKAPFTSEEKLTVTMASGKVIEIVVTDAQEGVTITLKSYDESGATPEKFEPVNTTGHYWVYVVLTNKETNSQEGWAVVPADDFLSQDSGELTLSVDNFKDIYSDEAVEYDRNKYDVGTRLLWCSNPNQEITPAFLSEQRHAQGSARTVFDTIEGYTFQGNGDPNPTDNENNPAKICLKKDHEQKSYALRFVFDDTTGNVPSNGKYFVMGKIPHQNGDAYFYVPITAAANKYNVIDNTNPGTQLVWLDQNGNKKQGEHFIGNEAATTLWMCEWTAAGNPDPQLGQLINKLNGSTAAEPRVAILNDGSVVGSYFFSLDTDRSNRSDGDVTLYYDTVHFTKAVGGISRDNVLDTLDEALGFGLYTSELTGHRTDMEANIAAGNVPSEFFTKTIADYGFSGRNMNVNKLTVTKTFTQDGNPLANQQVTIRAYRWNGSEWVIAPCGETSNPNQGEQQSGTAETTGTTDENGKLTVSFDGLQPGRYQVREVLTVGGERKELYVEETTIGHGPEQVTATFGGEVIFKGSGQNINYFADIDDGASQDMLMELIRRSRHGVLVIENENDYNRMVAANNALSSAEQGTIVRPGTEMPDGDNAPHLTINQNIGNYRILSATLASSLGSETVKVYDYTLSEIVSMGQLNLTSDDKLVVVNIDMTDAGDSAVIPVPTTLDGETLEAQFNQDGKGAARRIIYNPYVRDVNGVRSPYTGTIDTSGTTSGTLLAPAATVKDLGGNWGGTVISAVANHGGSEIHSEYQGRDREADSGVSNTKGHEAATGTGELKFKKDLGNGNQWPKDGENNKKLTFTLTATGENASQAPMPIDDDDVRVTSMEITSAAEYEFKTLHFTEADCGNTYTYEIAEDGWSGWTASAQKIYVKVEVGQPTGHGANRHIPVNITYSTDGSTYGDAASFYTITNTLQEGSLKLKKTVKYNGSLTSREELNGTYSFTVSGPGTGASATTKHVTITILNGEVKEAAVDGNTVLPDADGYVEVKNLLEGEYTLTEDTSTLPEGISLLGANDKKVTVVAGETGSEVSAKAEFVNNYARGTIQFTGEKSVDGRTFKDGDSVTVKIGAVSPADAPMPAQAEVTFAPTEANPTYQFGAITFTSVDLEDVTPDADGKRTKPFKYEITESACSMDGVDEVDTTKYDVTVTVEIDANGAMTVTPSRDKDSFDFTNEYDASGKATLKGTKDIEGREFKQGDSATIKIEAISPEGAPMPDPAELTIKPTSGTSKSFQFSDITYKLSYLDVDDESGLPKETVFTYKVTESAYSMQGVEKDDTTYEVTVTVKDNGDGTLDVVASDNAESLNFVNTYDAKGTTVVGGTKKLENRKLKSTDKWTYTLAGVEGAPIRKTDGGESVPSITAENGGSSTFTFGTLYFQLSDLDGVDPDDEGVRTKTFQYTITESGTVAGVTNDTSNPKTIEITVTDDGSGTLIVTQFPNNSAAEFVNTYDASGKAKLQAKKALGEGDTWPDGKEATFTLTAVTEGAPMPAEADRTRTLTEAGTVEFGEIEYPLESAGKTSEYTIAETSDWGTGWSVDPTEITATVEVSADTGTGELTTTVTYDPEGFTVTNDYNTKGEITFSGTKELTGRKLKEGEFLFDLYDSEGTLMESVPNAADGSYSFTTIEYTGDDLETNDDGTYKPTEKTYKVVERAGNDSSVKYDDTEYEITVTLTDNGEGKIDCVADPAENTYDFTNEYHAEGETTLKGNKSIDGRSFKEGDSATFKIVATGEFAGIAPMPAEDTVTIEPTSGTSEDFEFATIHYTLDDLKNVDDEGNVTYDKVRVFTYEVTEDAFSMQGVGEKDSTTYTVNVTVRDNGTGNLIVTTSDNAKALNFKNKYEAEGSITLDATKAMSGRDFKEGDEYTFNVNVDKAGAPLPAQTSVTITPTSGSKTEFSFGDIKYTLDDAGETYTYTVTETGTVDGVTIDTAKTVTVSISDNGDGTLSVKKGDEVIESAVVDFTNEFNEAEAPIQATKQFNDWGKAKSFTFNLAAIDGAPQPLDADGNEVRSAEATEDAPTALFGTAKYGEAGVYKYTITEVDDGVDGVTYDTDPHEVVVTVTKDAATNALSASVKYDDADALIITNNYDSTKANLQATKAFEDWGKADSFEFTLASVDGAPMPEEAGTSTTLAKTVTKDAPTAVFGEVDYKKAGTYKYTITETKGDADGVTYDTTPHEVVVTVAKGGNNKLSTSVKYDGADALIITNTYETTKATIEAAKEFNDWGKADHFDFLLEAVTKDAPMPASSKATATEAYPTASFDEITYETCGTYEYTVTEVNGGADGVTYDTTPHKVTVEVTKDADNKMSAEVIYADGDSLIITNTYTATEAPIEATKNFSSWGKAESFIFDLAPVSENAPMPLDSKGNAVTTATATKDAIKASFGTVKYEKAGTYEYTITERNDHVDGVTYDTTPHTVKVEVTKDVDTNELTAKVIYDGDKTALNITNTYEGVKKGFEVTKQFNDWGKAKSFTFDLAAVTKDAPMPEVTEATATEANPTAVFDEVEFGKAGIYEYTITERNDGADGVTYDTTPHAVTVIVSKDADSNTLSAEVKYDGKASLIVTNTYAATKATIEATKEFNDWGKADSFTFDLAAVTEGAPMPDNTTAVATDANNTATFDEITYEKAGTYEYTVTERNDGADGVTYDTTPHKVTVTVTKDDTTNALSATVDYDGAKSLIVTNTFEATQATIEATKQFDAWGKADEFKFDLAAVTEGAPMPTSTVATATEANPTATFETITFEKAGTYEYTVTERDGKADGVTYDLTAYPVTVTVTKDADTNKLSAEVSYGGEKQLIITNTYAATEAQFSVTKEFEDWGKADEFKFDLAAVTEGAPMPAETTVTATKANKTVSFEKLTFEKAGTYEYTITEQNGGADGVTYDTTAHAVTVIVSKANDNTNALSAEVRYDGENVDSLIVTNTYEAAKATIKATKQFNDWGKAESFTFTLTPSDGSPMPVDADGNVVKTAVATKDAVDAIFGEINYEAAGTYTYSIAEVNDHVDGVTYDTSAHRVVVEVTKADDATNKLTAKVAYDGADALIITNTYASTKAVIQATKAFEDWGKADIFVFTLASVDGAPMPDEAGTSTTLAKTVTKAEPTAVFGEIDYKKAGTYEYTITETKGDADGVTYDTAEHKVTVTVAKDADTNELVATVDYDGAESLIITNTYAGTETTLEATKQFEDWGKADSFTFTVAPVSGAPAPEKATAVATEDEPTASFGTVKFEKAGTYEYTITELNGGADGVTYDTTPHAVTVIVSKDADNKLSAAVKYDGKDSLVITNAYAATQATIEAEKEFNDWGKADSFTFDLAAIEGAPLPASTVATATEAEPVAKFGEITFEKAGTYRYTVTERNDGVDGVTYDTTPHTVVVNVTKDAETNALSATVDYDGAESLAITNTFTAAEATLEATKKFEDWSKADSFTFKLAAVTAGAPMPEAAEAKATEKTPVASFGKVAFDKAGTYEYTITEVNDHVDGVTYDTAAHKVTVTVTKDAETNALSAKVDYDGAEKLIVTNTFKAAEATIEATKSINVWGEESEFTFELAAVDGAPMPATAKDGKATAVATKDAPTVAFGAISYDKAGEYKYTVTEVAGEAKYVAYDTTAHAVTVTVAKDAETNALTAKVSYGDAEKLTITNTYSATGKLELAGKKAITNKPDDMDLSGFKFTVKEGDKTVATGQSAADGTITFTAIEYALADAGDHTYVVSEDADATKPGVTNTTDTVTVKVSVTDNGDGTLKVAKAADGEVEINAVNFTNSFTATKGELKVKKNLVGRAWKDGDTFEFTATPVGDAPKLSKTKVTITNATTGATESFGEIEFKEPGSYTYTVKETKGTITGLTYDTAEHRITFKVVTDDKGNLVAAEGSALVQTAEVTNTYKENEQKKTTTTTKSNLAKTGDTFDPTMTAGLAVIGLLVVAFGLRKRREHE